MKALINRQIPKTLLNVICIMSLCAGYAFAGIRIEPIKRDLPLPLAQTQFRALVIGNNNYIDNKGRWPNLKTAIKDARAVADTLKSHYHFEDVTLLENASRRDILLQLAELTKRVQDNDSVLVYYAGHGYLDQETQRGYWIPVDAQGDDSTTYLRNSTIRDELTTIASRAKHTLLISDSCFSGSLLRSDTRSAKPLNNVDRYYEKVANKKSVQIIAAGGVEYVDDDYNNSGHSPFTYFLLNELNSNNRPLVTVSELSSNVEKAVANNVSQVPESGVLHGAGDELGEFIFLKFNISVQVQGVPKDKVKVDVNITPTTDTSDIAIEKNITVTSDTPAQTAKPVTEDKQQSKEITRPTPKQPFSVPLPTL